MEFTWPELPDTVPFLKEYGSNCARFQEAMLATCQWDYFEGINTCPVPPKDVAHPTNAEREAVKEWEHEDAVAQYLLFARFPNWLAHLGLDNYPTTRMQWDWLTRTSGQPGHEESRKEKEPTGEPPCSHGKGEAVKKGDAGANKHHNRGEEGHCPRDCRAPKEEPVTALLAQEPQGAAAEQPENSPTHTMHAADA